MTFERICLRIEGVDGERAPLSEHPVVRAALTGKARRFERTESLYDTPDRLLLRRGIRLTAWRTDAKWQACVHGMTSEGGARGREWSCGDAEGPEWSGLKRQLPEALLEGVKGRELVPLFTVAMREERWRLEYPDGTRMVMWESHGLLEGSWGEESWHEVRLESETGMTVRFLQTVLALARHCAAGLEPLSPLERGVARLHPEAILSPELAGCAALPGERLVDALVRLGRAQLDGLSGQLAALRAGTGASAARAVERMLDGIAGLHDLVNWFAEFLPIGWQREMVEELLWLRGELLPCRAGDGVVGELNAQRRGVSEPERLSVWGAAVEFAREQAWQRARQATGSLRCARLLLGFAIWLHGAEGVKGAAAESDSVAIGRLDLPVEGVARELLRGLHRPLRGWAKVEIDVRAGEEALNSPGEALLHMERAVAWFGGLFVERKAGGYCAGLSDLAGFWRAWRDMNERERLWQQLSRDRGVVAALAAREEEALRHWVAGWQAARMHAVVEGMELARERFVRMASPFARE
ncbi:MAG: hypothetical protein H7834_09645 [Magnetococcus sp. YQC-9]